MSIFSRDDLLFNRNAPQRDGPVVPQPLRGPLATQTASGRNQAPQRDPRAGLPAPRTAAFDTSGGEDTPILFGGADEAPATEEEAPATEEGDPDYPEIFKIIGETLSSIAGHLDPTKGDPNALARGNVRRDSIAAKSAAARLARDKFDQSTVGALLDVVIKGKTFCDPTPDPEKRKRCYAQIAKIASAVPGFENVEDLLNQSAEPPGGVTEDDLANFVNIRKYMKEAALAMGVGDVRNMTPEAIGDFMKGAGGNALFMKNVVHPRNLQDAAAKFELLNVVPEFKQAVAALRKNQSMTVRDFSRMAQSRGKDGKGAPLFDPSTIFTLTTTPEGIALLAENNIRPRPDPGVTAKLTDIGKNLELLAAKRLERKNFEPGTPEAKVLDEEIAKLDAATTEAKVQGASPIQLLNRANILTEQIIKFTVAAGRPGAEGDAARQKLKFAQGDLERTKAAMMGAARTPMAAAAIKGAVKGAEVKAEGGERLNKSIVSILGIKPAEGKNFVTLDQVEGDPRYRGLITDLPPQKVTALQNIVAAGSILYRQSIFAIDIIEKGGRKAKGLAAVGGAIINAVQQTVGAFEDIAKSNARDGKLGASPTDPNVRTFAASTDIETYKSVLIDGKAVNIWQEIDELNERAQSAILGLAFSGAMAIAAQEGRGLSDTDVAIFIQRFGGGKFSFDPKISVAKIKDMLNELETVYASNIKTHLGVAAPDTQRDRLVESVFDTVRAGRDPPDFLLDFLTVDELRKLQEAERGRK